MLDKDQILKYLNENFTQHGDRKKSDSERKASKQIRERRKFGIVANLGYCRYELVRKTVEEAGFVIKNEEDLSDAFLIWTDNFLPLEKIMNLKHYQRINHFPGMIEICRKDFLAKNCIRMNRLEPVEYSFVPKTWVLPQEQGFLLNYTKRALSRGQKPTFIMKPANGAMGHGIRMFRAGESVPSTPMSGTPCVVQEYINNPLLIDGFKCDLRVYVLITSCDPLRIFIYNDGLVRLGTEKYVDPTEPNGESMYMHLTNYAVNKRHAGYVSSPDEMHGSKRSFSFLDQYLRNTRQVDPHTVWRSIRDLIVKTMAIAAPHLLHSYRMCRRGQPRIVRTFSLDAMAPRTVPKSSVSRSQVRNESNITDRLADFGRQQHGNRGLSVPFCQSSFFEILGFDILLDADLKPWLIEVNRSPSFNGDQELDRRVKHGLLKDALRLLNIRPTDKENIEKEQKLHSFRRLYRNNAPVGHFRQKEPTRDVSTDRCLKATVGKSQSTQANVPSYCWEQTDPVIEKEISKLRQQLLIIRRRLALEFFEYHNCGNWCLIFPTDDRTAQKRFASFMLANFAQFHKGKSTDLLKELEETYLYPVTEDFILEKLNNLTKKCAHQGITVGVSFLSSLYVCDMFHFIFMCH
ncbi:Tubulin polyglutamylase TTLL7 [Paragonimus heterotremus]|uniref:Tubulin polyglutamylase TTLL7 n=1 Tax=Paragonimus heterotremus TaxID=100268 RepID=A0A8J4SM30_9TREM|nr:Tubulin polyglutamylase TTLL7 [Paragonimus heterotremus]